MTDTTTDPRITTPRSAGTPRSVKDLKPGWWVHMMATPGNEDRGDAWEEISWIADLHSGARQVGFNRKLDPDDPKDGNMVTADGLDVAVVLTAREAKRYGLTMAETNGAAA